MKVELDNGQRVFHVVTSMGKQAFCNLKDLNKVVENLETHEGHFRIYHFWNNKPKRVSKKYLKEMFKANRIEMGFVY
ncbi:MAG: hypothetical protein KDC67_10015 [Ignavibacteriae bacterium]|nr:hypothetical protein [Ignavibacteriota bacterium]